MRRLACVIHWLGSPRRTTVKERKRGMGKKGICNSVFTVILAVAVFSSSAALADVTEYFRDDFEGWDLGNSDIGGNWYLPNSAHVAGVVNTKAFGGSEQSVSLGSETTTSAQLRLQNAIPQQGGALTSLGVNAKVWLGEVESYDNFRFQIYATDNNEKVVGVVAFWYTGSSAASPIEVMYSEEYTTQVVYLTQIGLPSSGATTPLGKWLDVSLTFNLENDTYAFSIVDTTNGAVLAERSDIQRITDGNIEEIRFSSGRRSSKYDNQRYQYMDDVVLVGVPEPMTGSLMLLSGGVMAMIKRRK